MAYDTTNVLTRVQKLVKNADADVLTELIRIVEDYCKVYLRVDLLPDLMETAVVEITVARFNRLGSEGYKNESVEGLSIEYNDFVEAYAPMLNMYRKLKSV